MNLLGLAQIKFEKNLKSVSFCIFTKTAKNGFIMRFFAVFLCALSVSDRYFPLIYNECEIKALVQFYRKEV